jgi:hypothetical protein
MQFLKALNLLFWPLNLLLIDIYGFSAYLGVACVATQDLDGDGGFFEQQRAQKIAVIFGLQQTINQMRMGMMM